MVLDTTTAASADRRRAILDAALDAIDAKGLLAATLDDIKDRSGASIGSIYHHFGDKEGIAAALYAQLLAEWQDGFVKGLRGQQAEAGGRGARGPHPRSAAGKAPRRRFPPPSRPPR